MRLSIRTVRDAVCIACVFCIAFNLQAAADNHINVFPVLNNGESGGRTTNMDPIGVHGIRLPPEAPSIWLDVPGGSGSGLLYQQNDGDGGWGHVAEGQPTPPDPNANDCKKVASGNPVLLGSQNKVETELDFSSEGEMPLSLVRTYNLNWLGRGIFGGKWHSSFDYRLTFGNIYETLDCHPRPGGGVCGIGTHTTIHAWRPDGRTVTFHRNPGDGVFYEDKAIPVAKIVPQANGDFIHYTESNQVETYSSAGYISTVKNEQGIGWTFSYVNGTYPHRVTHTSGRYVEFHWNGNKLVSVRDPAGNHFGYAYPAEESDHWGPVRRGYHHLAAAVLPDATAVTYHYQHQGVHSTGALTGKSINGVRYSTFTYEAGWPVSTEHQGQDRYSFVYTPGVAGAMTVLETNPLGKRTTYEFRHGKLMTVVGHPSSLCAGAGKGNSYDQNGYLDVVTDFNGNVSDYDYNPKGQLLKLTKGVGTPLPRITEYTWDPVRNRLLTVTLQGQSRTTYSYTPDHRIASVSVTNLSGHGERAGQDHPLHLHRPLQRASGQRHRGRTATRKPGRGNAGLQRAGRPDFGQQQPGPYHLLCRPHRARTASQDYRRKRRSIRNQLRRSRQAIDDASLGGRCGRRDGLPLRRGPAGRRQYPGWAASALPVRSGTPGDRAVPARGRWQLCHHPHRLQRDVLADKHDRKPGVLSSHHPRHRAYRGGVPDRRRQL